MTLARFVWPKLVRFDHDVKDPGPGGDHTRTFTTVKNGKSWLHMTLDLQAGVLYVTSATHPERETFVPIHRIVQFEVE